MGERALTHQAGDTVWAPCHAQRSPGGTPLQLWGTEEPGSVWLCPGLYPKYTGLLFPKTGQTRSTEKEMSRGEILHQWVLWRRVTRHFLHDPGVPQQDGVSVTTGTSSYPYLTSLPFPYSSLHSNIPAFRNHLLKNYLHSRFYLQL